MNLFLFIVVGCIVWYVAHQHDKKMNENFMNFLIRFEKSEYRIQELEILQKSQEKDIEDLRGRIRDLEERIFNYENPYS